MSRAASPNTEAQASAVHRELRRRKLIRFAEYMQADYAVNWHHKLIADRLDEVRKGNIRRILFFTPPQHGKSALISRHWPAHLLGNEPDTKIIATSYSSELAEYNGREVRRLIKSHRYRDTFPGFRLKERSGAMAKMDDAVTDRVSFFQIPNHSGYYLGAGIMGSMTGFGFDVGILDDPIKNMEEADSEEYRKKLKDAYTAVFESRGRGIDGPGGIPDRIVGVFTRWHEDDLGGYLQKVAKESGELWEVVSLPAIKETDEGPDYDPRKAGEALWPQRYPLEELLKRKRKMLREQPRIWWSLYQQTPRSEDGGIFQRNWWRYFDLAEVMELRARGGFDRIWQTWDANFKETGTSRCVGLVLARKGADYYVLDREIGRFSYVELKDAIQRMSARWPEAYEKVVEDRANGPALISDLRSTLGGLIAWPPPGTKFVSKEARWNAAQPPVRARNVLLPPTTVHWVQDFIDELHGVPTGKYDDQADAFAQGILFDRDAIDPLDGLGQW